MPVDLSPLREHFQGVITTPSSPTFERERVLFNTRIRRRPQVLARCSSTEDVVAAVRFARDVGMPFAVRGGGHHACGFSLAEDGLVVDTGGLRGVSFDAATGTAVAGAGAGWREVDAATGAGRDGTRPGGDCPTVSNAGYSLGGGYGLLSRTFGLACDHIEAAELVDATGAVLSVTEDEHPDLLWALRGAGAGRVRRRHPAPLPARPGAPDGLRWRDRLADRPGRVRCSAPTATSTTAAAATTGSRCTRC